MKLKKTLSFKVPTVVHLRGHKYGDDLKVRIHLEMFEDIRWGENPAGHQLFLCLNLKALLITCGHGRILG